MNERYGARVGKVVKIVCILLEKITERLWH